MTAVTRVRTNAGKSRSERRPTGLQWLAIIVPALACLALCLNTLGRLHVLSGIQTYGGGGYDDGLHVGAALRLTSLELPYRDYVFLHPPGIAVLLWPVAVVGRLVSEQDAMALGRLLVTAFSVANVALVAWLVRKRGPVAMLAAGTFLALSPLTVATTRTTLHEPFMILFVLLGMAALFPGNELAPKNRTSLAGLFFGLALSIKLLAFLPVVAVFIVLLRLGRDRLKMFALGLAVGFGMITIPFVALAPNQFVNQVLVSQIRRHQGSFARSISERFAMMLGLSNDPSSTQALVASIVFAVFFVLVAMGFVLRRREVRPFEWFSLISAAIVVLAMLRAPDLMEHYLYVSTAFLALLLGVTVGLVGGLIPREAGGLSLRWIAGFVMTLAIALAMVPLFSHDTSVAKGFVRGADDPIEWIQSYVPQGACIVADVSTILIVSDRFQSTNPDCPSPVDPFGIMPRKVLPAVPPHAPIHLIVTAPVMVMSMAAVIALLPLDAAAQAPAVTLPCRLVPVAE